MENLIRIWPLFRINLQHLLQNGVEVRRVVRWNLGVHTFQNSVVESFHVFGRKWWIQSNQLVENAAQ